MLGSSQVQGEGQNQEQDKSLIQGESQGDCIV